MTTQAGYWEPRQATGGTNRFAATMVLLIAALVVGGIFLFMLPSHSGIMTLIGQQPTPTAADIAKLYVEELWGKGNQDFVKTLMAADFVDHDPMFVNNGRVVSANDKNNSAVFTYNIEILGRTFPDLSVKTEDVVEGNDRVVVRWTFTGTSTGTFITYTGTDKRVTMTNTDILRIMDGKIVERWGVNRLASLMEAMDVVTVTQPVAEAVSAFARFAYMYSANTIDDLGEAFGDQVEFNGDALSLKDFKVVVADAYKALDGISNIRITSATVIGNRLLADIEFDTSNGIIHNKGYVVINLKDGKIATYDFYGR